MATTSLGRLTLDLAVGLSEFTDGLSQAERATTDSAKKMGESVGKFKEQLVDDLSGTAIGDAVGSLNEKLSSITEAFGESGLAGAAAIGAASIIGSVAAIGAGLVTLALRTAETDEQLERLATRAKTSTANLQVLTAATGAYGLEMESVGDILADAQEKLGEFSATGGGGLVDTLELMQNATKKTDAELEIFGRSLSTMDSVDAIQAVVNEMEKADATTQEVRFVTESLASGLGDIIPLWDNNGEALRDYERDLNEAGVIRTKESIEQSQLLANELEGLQIKLEGVSNQIVTKSLPAMIGLIDYMKTGTTDADGLSDSLSSLGLAAAVIATPFIGLMSVFKQVGTVVAGLMGSISSLFSLMSNVLSNPFKIGTYLQEYARSTGQLGQYMIEDMKSERDRAVGSLQTIWSSPRELANRGKGYAALVPGASAANYGVTVNEEIIASRAIADAEEEEAKAKEKTAKANDKKTASLNRQAEAQARLVGITGDTGVGRAHLDVRYARGDARYGQEISAADVARFQANSKALTNYPMTSGFGKRNTGIKGASTFHLGNDYATPIGTKITTKVAVTDVKTWYDKNGGGYVSTVEFADGVKINLLHQSPESKGIKGGSSGSKDAYSGANDQAQQLLAKHQADVLRQQEELERARLSISQRYATDKEKIERDHTKNVTEIERLYAEGSDDRAKYLAREKERYEIEKNAGLQSISEKYFSEEQRIHDAHKKAMAVIDQQFAENDPNRQLYVDLQNAAYQEDLANFKFAAGAKAREQDKMYQSLANSMKANGLSAASTGLDAMAQRTMSGQDYEVWRLAQDHDESFNSVNSQYSNRQAEINAVDERGEFALPELERFELLELAKQEHLDSMWAMEQEYALKDQTLAEQQAAQRVAIYQGLFAGMTNAASVFFGENSRLHKLAFAAEQAYAVHKALMNVEETYSNTFNSLSAIPLIGPYIAAPGAAVAAGLQVASATRIQGMSAPSIAGIAHGGLDNVPAEATYLLQKDERVLSPKQNKDLVKFMANGQKVSAGNITINNNSSAQVSASRGPNGEVTIEMVDKMMDKRFRNIGRANSLESKAIQRGTTARVNRR